MDEIDLARQNPEEPVPEECMGMPPAKLHEPVATPGHASTANGLKDARGLGEHQVGRPEERRVAFALALAVSA
jgi:hypothetical protein